MAQGLFGGTTSYGIQSLKHILEDINWWIKYSNDTKTKIESNCSILKQNDYWGKVRYNFRAIISSTILCIERNVDDFELIKSTIEKNKVTEKEVKLLDEIGKTAMEYNREYPKAYKDKDWHDYGNNNFEIAEKLYQVGRDYFVTLEDASNAACRLENYVTSGSVTNNLNIHGGVYHSVIQQGAGNTAESTNISNSGDYDKVLKILNEIKKLIGEEKFESEFGDSSYVVEETVNSAIKMSKNKESSGKLEKILKGLKDIAQKTVNNLATASSNLIAKRILELLMELPFL